MKVFVDWPAAIVTVLVRSATSRKTFSCGRKSETSRASVVGPVRVSVKVMSSSLNTALVLSAEMLTVGVTAACGASIASSEYGPALAPVRVALIRTVYVVPLVRLGIVWLAVEPELIVACRRCCCSSARPTSTAPRSRWRWPTAPTPPRVPRRPG